MLSLLCATGAAAVHIGTPWFEQPAASYNCKDIAGTFAVVEKSNEYDNQNVGSGSAQDDTINGCQGGIAFLVITEDCAWQYKKVMNDGNSYCKTTAGWSSTGITKDQTEFYEIKATYGIGTVVNPVDTRVNDFVFTIETIPGVAGTSARRIQGVAKTEPTFNGAITIIPGQCDIAFEGWAVQRDFVTECNDRTVAAGRDLNAFGKRDFSLTSTSSTVDVSDVKKALAVIANAIPEWSSSTSSSTTSTTHHAPGCLAIAGVYQIVETINEHHSDEVGTSDNGLNNGCNGGLAYLQINPGCSWQYKKVSVGEHVPANTAPIFRCEDDSGTGPHGVETLENEFCKINRAIADFGGNDWKFAVERIEGGDDAAMRIHGIVERRFDGAIGSGCDIAFEGWRVQRQAIVPCKDRCYSAGNGDFEQGFFNFQAAALFTRVNSNAVLPAVGALGTNNYALATNPSRVNALFQDRDCDGVCLVSSMTAFPGGPNPTFWWQYYPFVGDSSCCESQTYAVSFDAFQASAVSQQIDVRVHSGSVFNADSDQLIFATIGAPGFPVTPIGLTPARYTTVAFSYFGTQGVQLQFRVSDVAVNGAIVLDNIVVSCLGVQARTNPSWNGQAIVLVTNA